MSFPHFEMAEAEKEIVHFKSSNNPEMNGATHLAIQKGQKGKLIWAVYHRAQVISDSVKDDPNTELVEIEVAKSKYDFQPFLEGV